MKRKILSLSFLFLGLAGYAEPIDWNKRLPADPNVLIGKLPNGITYYLRHNEEPKERASFFIIRNAGALLENDDQDGLAHFLEHMAFNGSKNFPGNVLYKGSKYAVRDVIGNMDVVRTFKPETLRDFYHKWYRTDLEAIAVVGDFDVRYMEEKVKKVFSSIPVIPDPEPRPFFGIPSHDETYFCLATDKEATSSDVQVIRIFRDKEYDGKGYATYQDVKNSLMISFYNNMAAERIGEAIQRGQAPYVTAAVGFYGMTRGYYAYSVSATAKPDQEREALSGALEEHERIFRHGFTEDELSRAKANMLADLESMVKDKDKTSNDAYAEEIQSHFLSDEAIIDIEDYAEAVREILPAITAEEVSAQARRWWKADNRTLVVSGPSEGAAHLTEQEARGILAETEGKEVAAYEDNGVKGDLIEKEPAPGTITEVKELPQFQAEEWTLDNGARVVYRKADYEKDEVELAAYSPGGSSLYADVDSLPAVSNAGQFASSYGLGAYDEIALGKLLTSKKARCEVFVGGLYENVNGSSTPKDFETMMQLMYLRFMEPRFDTLAHKVIIERNRIHAKQIAGQPQTMMRDSISLISADYNPRVQLFNEAYVDKLTLDRIEKAYRDRICDASDFTFFIVGNVDKDTARVMARRYIGSLPSLYRNEKWVDRRVRAPKGKVEKDMEIPMESPKSTVMVMFNKEMKYTLKEAYVVDILGDILTNRYTNTIREEQGGTYNVGVGGSASREPYNNYTMYMTFECDPEKAGELKPLLYKEVDDIVREGVTEEELGKVVKNTLKEAEQSKRHNAYWLTTLITYYKTGVNLDDPENMEDLVASIRPGDVQDFARKFFKDADVVDLTFSPQRK